LKFTKSPTEKTTAVTDILLALVAAGAIWYLQWLRSAEVWKINTWSWAFGFIALSGLLGALAHGLELTEAMRQRIWNLLNLGLGVAVSVFVIGVAYDAWGLAVASKILPWMVVMAVGFYFITRIFPGIFFIFIVYEALALFFAWGAYSWLAFTGQLNGSLIMAVGILVSIIAASIQATKNVSFKMIFEFDHNGIFHIVQIIGILLLLAGLRLSLQPH
jgi:hypothetical protein